MERNVNMLEKDDRDWLEAEAVRQGVPMTELMRRAVLLLRTETEQRESFDDLLATTAGTWPQSDGLEYARQLRAEWDRGPA